MNTRSIVIAVIIIILIIISALYLSRNKVQEAADLAPAAPYVEEPTVGSVPDVNPAGRVNPLKDVKTNPFE